jgi:hypothetical protein
MKSNLRSRTSLSIYKKEKDYLVNLLDANKANTTTLNKEKYGVSDLFGNIGQALSSHEVDQIKKSDSNYEDFNMT